jgi:quercetin dioxygenase-like cupin family protein
VQVPEHTHEGDEVGLIMAGTLEMSVDGHASLVREGQTFLIPRGAPHAARTTDTACRRFERYAPRR